MKKTVWLERSLVVLPFYLALFTDPDDYYKELKKLEIEPRLWPDFVISERANASVHFFTRTGKKLAIVCIQKGDYTGVEIAGLLVHEAVHIWQEMCSDIGERFPSDEFEAYSIQSISQQLMIAYRNQSVE